MKTLTNHQPGARGVNLKDGTTTWIEPGQSVEIDMKDVVGGLPDLGKAPAGGEADAGDSTALAAENADLRKQIDGLTAERDALKAENADLRKGKEAPTTEDITAAVGMLDKGNDAHWTDAGLPAVDAVRELLGADVTRKQIEAAAPDAKRPTE